MSLSPRRDGSVRRRAVGRRVSAAVVVTVTTVGVACASPPLTRTLSTDAFLARPYQDLYLQLEVWPERIGRLPDDFGVITYNIAPGVLGHPAGDLPDSFSPSGFRILAICYSEPRREVYVGVIPENEVTPAIERRARSHGYDDRLVECSVAQRSATFTVTAPPLVDGTVEKTK